MDALTRNIGFYVAIDYTMSSRERERERERESPDVLDGLSNISTRLYFSQFHIN